MKKSSYANLAFSGILLNCMFCLSDVDDHEFEFEQEETFEFMSPISVLTPEIENVIRHLAKHNLSTHKVVDLSDRELLMLKKIKGLNILGVLIEEIDRLRGKKVQNEMYHM